ncbi:probable permease of the major facilitator superfamily [Rhynchosporium graminicola]|uniref:Probable permease of the major facilitator superfamily n=1 Tax=Rhynchosporium graminicola TaxID=2792576 RepID=A0A1E1L2P6_9HELO|nr:probable permease of the major facilitator superfamily [Rhynchosporium commune]
MAFSNQQSSTELEKASELEQEFAEAPSSLPPSDPAAVKRLLRKCDLHVVPPLFVIFLMAFLDRSNIGNARIQGLEASLDMQGNDYNIALFMFFIPYILLEVPSNIIIKRVAPSTWLSAIVVLWGIATIGQGLVKNFAGLVACRFLVGIFEAGLFPGCIYLISMYYERYQLQWRLTLFFTASIIAGGLGGLLAYAISNMGGTAGYEAWRWIFIIEGLATVVIGAISKFWIVDWPETATFLTDEERALLIQQLSLDSGEANMNTLDKRAARRIFLDWKIYCGTLMYMGVVTTGYSSSFFIPTILRQMGYTAAMAQILSIPIFTCAAIVAVAVAFATDKLRHRFSFIILGVLVGSTGYAIMLNLTTVSVGIRYFACFLIVTGGYIAQPMGGHYKRSMSAAIQIGFGNCGGIVASNVFLNAEKPRYRTGFGTGMAFLIVLCGGMAVAMFFGLRAENRKRDRGGRDYRFTEEAADLDNMGDDHPNYRFTT